jgi:hypothetical protein
MIASMNLATYCYSCCNCAHVLPCTTCCMPCWAGCCYPCQPVERYEVPQSIRENVTIRLTGHSLGGAIATIAAVRFRLRGYKVELVTFGSPRVGNSYFRTFAQGEIGDVQARFVNMGDPIPSYPPLVTRYHHVGKRYGLGAAFQSLEAASQSAQAADDEEAAEEASAPAVEYVEDTACFGLKKVKRPKDGGSGHAIQAYEENLQKLIDTMGQSMDRT